MLSDGVSQIFLHLSCHRSYIRQGGYAALMLLCGLTANSGIYVLAAFRDNARCCSVRRLSGIEQYLKAFNQKFSAISLTLLSTILGLVPFLFSQSNDFWFSFAVGVMGGLVTSLVAIIFVVPVFLNLQERTHRCNLASISWRWLLLCLLTKLTERYELVSLEKLFQSGTIHKSYSMRYCVQWQKQA